MRVRSVGSSFVAAFMLAAAVPAFAQEVQVPASESLAARPYKPATLPQPALTLGEAVLLALRHNPDIARDAVRVQQARGRLLSARGLFDYTFRVAPSGTFTYQELLPGVIGNEQNKRELIRLTRDSFVELTDGLRKMIAGGATTLPLCPLEFRLSFPGLNDFRLDVPGPTISGQLLDPIDIAARGASSALGGQTFNGLTIDLGNLGLDLDFFDFSQICNASPEQLFNPDAFTGVYLEAIREIDFSGGRGLEGVLRSVEQIPQETRILQEQIFRTVAYRANLALDRLGPLPKDDLRRNFTIDASLSKPLRSGLIWRADFQIQAEEHEFIDKPRDPTFGGLGTPPMFFSTFSGKLTVPLGRGRGTKATAAQERAAEAQVTAGEEQVRHQASEQAFRTVLAYLSVVGAMDRVRALEESQGRFAEILKLSEQRVAGGAIAAIELERVRARQASVASSIAQAQMDLAAARVSLADTLGVSVTTLEAAPLASEAFATTAAVVPDVAQLIEQAFKLRRDTRAAAARQRSATLLYDAARTDARPLFDVDFTFGMSNLYESPLFKYLPDEGDPDRSQSIIDARAAVVTPPVSGTPIPPLSPVHYWNPRGYTRLMTGRFEPFATVRFTWELPFGNNAAKGRVAQAQATVSQSTIDVLNTDRLIRQGVVESAGILERTGASITQREIAIEASRRAFDSQRRQLETGNVTLIDLILTEESLAGDQQALVSQRQAYLSALARLKYELGEIVLFDNALTANELLRFNPAGFVIGR
jgi:outer membrane protein TolC